MANFSLYLIRHGIAAERGEAYPNDCDRPLTEEGRRKTRQVAKRLATLGLRFDLLLTSPLVRARQTAEIFTETVGYDCPLEVSQELAPEGDFDAWLNWWKAWQQSKTTSGDVALGLIGHEPDLSTWAEMLVWGDVRSVIVLKKAGVIGLAVPEPTSPVGSSILFLVIPPKLLI